MNLQINFNEIVNMIQVAREKAFLEINKGIINIYWSVGEYISEKIKNEQWGKSTVKNLSEFIIKFHPDLKGFSAQNIWRMKQFYEVYKEDEKLSTLSREVCWSINLHIISKCKTREEREFYLRSCIKERYSVRELERQIDSCFYERNMLSDSKNLLVPTVHEKIKNIFRDSYMMEFLDLSEGFKEKDLQKSIIKNLKQFVLEFGKDFIFVGEEYRLQVGKNDYFVDLLFYNRELACLVAMELKIDDFKPEYLGKLNFYLEALDRDIKKPHENPSVGIILCKSKDDDVVEYALSRNLSPTLVAEYQTKLIDKSILQKKLHELFECEDKE